MRHRGLILFVLSCVLFVQVAEAGEVPRVFVLDAESLAAVKTGVAANDVRWRPPMKRLRAEADAALAGGPFSVTLGGPVPPSGELNDYMSIGPYWWPDPEKEDGLPYIRRDGQVNPQYHEHDIVPLGRMSDAVATLALAYYLTDREPYAAHAARLLRAWFLDPKTRMNPHLQYGQAIPGRCTGRGIGLIETRTFIEVVDAVGMLAGSDSWTGSDQAALQAWFGENLQRTLESRNAQDEAAAENNHGTWYDAQVASFAMFVGRDDVARRVLSKVPEKRIARQIEPDGRQPLELARTKSFSYSAMNLQGMFTLAVLGQRVGIDLWNFQTSDDRSIRKALDYLAPLADGKVPWQHEQIERMHPESLYPLLRRAAIAYDEPSYEKRIEEIPGFDPETERVELLWLAP